MQLKGLANPSRLMSLSRLEEERISKEICLATDAERQEEQVFHSQRCLRVQPHYSYFQKISPKDAENYAKAISWSYFIFGKV